MKFQIIASGSKGNMTYIETKETKILIDAGISLKEAKNRVSYPLEQIDVIIITHNHSDHIKYLPTIARHTNAVVYIQKGSLDNAPSAIKDKCEGMKFHYIEANKKYVFRDFIFFTLLLSHDVDCLGLICSNNKKTLGYITDTGFLPIPYLDLLKKVDALVIESNHDIELLANSDRHWSLKERIFSIQGHMSNLVCSQIVREIVSARKVKTIILAHLSEDCNSEELAVDTVLSALDGEFIPQIMVAYQYQATEMVELKNDD